MTYLQTVVGFKPLASGFRAQECLRQLQVPSENTTGWRLTQQKFTFSQLGVLGV